MNSNSVKLNLAVDNTILKEPEYQDTSIETWNSKYRLKDKNNNPIDLLVDDTFSRVALAISEIETSERELWYNKFLWAVRSGAIPAGRILSNAGAKEYKPNTSTINCTVSGTINDSMEDIMDKVKEAGITLKYGCGIGYEFSTLRPKGAFVTGVNAATSGALPFMDVFDKMCFTVSSAGGRRGAQMATFSCFGDTTEILTDKGWVNIATLFGRILDNNESFKAVTESGEFSINNYFTKFYSQLYEIELEDGSKLEITNDHKLEVKNIVTSEVYLKKLSDIDVDIELVCTIKVTN